MSPPSQSPRPGLREEQLWFARAVMTGASLDEADRRLTAGPKLGARERIDVYRRGYEARLVECLADDYPVLKVALGDEAFETLCRTYVARFPSEAPNLNAYGRRMAGLCAGFAADLARLEWAIVEVIHEAIGAPLALEDLASVPPDAWPTARLIASPATRLLRLDYPANDYFQAVRDGHDPPRPAPAVSATVVYRNRDTVWRMGLHPTMHGVLAALLGGELLEAALALAGDEPPEQVSAWFREWVSSGLFVRVQTD
jgi:hypothetical protein